MGVVGSVSADVGQNCVVTLEPIENKIEENVDLLFAPAVEAKGAEKGKDIVEEAEPPEPLIGGMVDLAAIATEFVLLGIDPYPRKPGAVFAAPRAEEEGGHPFAALAALKKAPKGEKS
jgi:uncharacterized metal-binding protein YceD (DUF177 family)